MGPDQPTLSDEDIRSLQYFCQEKGDPTRWVGWEEKKGLIALQLPALMFAWLNLRQAERVFHDVARSLKTSDEL
jgi:hypothetical protein